ncbi:HAMP domain-containing histidine kinase [Litoribacter ruber]|uniref:sensor histidine kinase n=1 Tax=Litoribacter ruber TaxID=702568 RepID=UPI001BDA86DA|nr:HAMP domain-containing sensor histidine kinase [Litoribacter ruber]MBT0811178.1 HAMP domain-containing histidine kinase [Litoribacter ruber]
MLKKRRLILFIAIASLAVLLGVNFFTTTDKTDEEQAAFVNAQMNKVVDEFDDDYITLLMNNRPDKQVSFRTLNIPTKHPFYLFTVNGGLLYWSSITMIPEFDGLDLTRKYQLYENQKGIYFIKLRKINRLGQLFWMVQVYTLYDKIDINNEYLDKGENPDVFGNDRFILSSTPKEGYQDLYKDNGEYYYSILFRTGYQHVSYQTGTVVLVFFFSIMGLVIILGSDFVRTLWKKGKQSLAIIYSAIILISIRAIMIFFHFPQEYFDTQLFNPSKYASSLINPSLGDLLLNVLTGAILLFLMIAMLSRKVYLVQFFKFKRQYKEWFFHYVSFLLSTILLMLFFRLFTNIVNNSQWELNILTVPTFTYFQGISLFIIFLGGAAYLLFTLIAITMVLYKNKTSRRSVLTHLMIFSVPIVAYLGYDNLTLLVVYLAHVILLVSIITFELHKNVFKLDFNTFLTFFYGCLIGAIITGAGAYQDNRKKEIQSKIKYANQLMVENDIMAEFLLSEAMNNIEEDYFIKSRMSDPLQSKDPIEQKIRRVFMSNYFDQYDLTVKIFNTRGELISQRETEETLEDYRFQHMKSDYATPFRNLYFIRNTAETGSNRFYSFVSLYSDDQFLGTILLELVQKSVQPSSVFPKLLLDREYANNLYAEKYDYAVFEDGIFKMSVGIYNYRNPENENLIENPALYTTGVYKNNHHHFGVKGPTKTIIVTSPIYPSNYVLADVSLFFVAYLLFTLICILVYSLFQGFGRLQFNYTTQLQFYINFAFFFPMLIISIISIGLLTNSYTDDLHRQYFNKATIIRNNLASYLEEQTKGAMDREQFLEEVHRLAGTTGTDINVYMPNGRLMATNQPSIFEKKVLTDYLHPLAVGEILETQNNRLILDEQVGNLNYKTVYLALRDNERQRILGIISIPFFESESELNMVIADVFSNILNIFVVIFVIFLVVSFFVSKQLIFPFRLLTEKLKATNLESNEPMYWPGKDEIGLLVNEYNNMLYKLESSKKILASTEKESAWREMAKQVAHEIKNPLTPMKLTLQHMLRLQAAGQIEDTAQIVRPVESLILQVDTLSDIATSFSTFAKMPLPQSEPIDFKFVVHEAVELFKNNEKGKVCFQDDTVEKIISIIGDEKLFSRIISNLIINGMQAVPDDRVPEIFVHLTSKNSYVKLEIRDNGKGIPEELKDKIFVPNFSTKSEGSGLGLAIARRGVETAGGKIWFETKLGEGTSFYLSFPKISMKLLH